MHLCSSTLVRYFGDKFLLEVSRDLPLSRSHISNQIEKLGKLKRRRSSRSKGGREREKGREVEEEAVLYASSWHFH
ncbi:hypothetical protein K1719_041481 [Acacia pycnantha]|nr:hypothetical protein K1719_041481 [Acacia pycnantha]